ncbi:L,D-transpeptidase family protein [Hyphomicrobiales bacterium BP6-180914]|uniref:L,D-transpeptidase family protein n=1 Tax=Lichenifustis flavocetrariae TaxID=2949735 RepID=A0AA42CH62_9HYPH|nr:L,D-transpeptidase family protein [Lichenifustis flavocetrariae]MCW6507248.1 L,D-transpeptidase family protein [Lichenifustis flavocetrariae]
MIPCSLGPAGISHRKREGDGATPAGTFRLEAVMFRSDRKARPLSALGSRPLCPRDGWCDDPASTNYNQPVNLPSAQSHEHLWRNDTLYDLIVVIDHNRHPARKRKGSAIFLHVRDPAGAPTAGCIAVDAAALRRVLARISGRTSITIG